MWLSLLGMLGGGLMRLIPFVVDFFKGKADADHEYRMAQLQLEIDRARATQAIDLANVQAGIAQGQGELAAWADAIKGQAEKTGNSWADGMSASVRPVLTYWWCLVLYTAAKVCTIAVAWQAHPTIATLSPLLVTDFDQAVISSILSFWFVDRAIRRAAK